MGHKIEKDENRCFICNKVITEAEMENFEMITGPHSKKVFVCINHAGISKEIKEDNE